MGKFSQAWADSLAQRDDLEHSGHVTYGENLYLYGTTVRNYALPANDPVDAWYSEIGQYKYYGAEPPTTVFEDIGECATGLLV